MALKKWKDIYDFSKNVKIKCTFARRDRVLISKLKLRDHLNSPCTDPQIKIVKFDNAMTKKFTCEYCINQLNFDT